MGGGRTSHEQGVQKKRPLIVPARRGPSGEGRGGGTAERGPARQRPPTEQCPEEVTVVLPPTEALPIGSQVSLAEDPHSPSGVALVYGNRLIPLRAESVSGAVRVCVSQGVRYVGTIEPYGASLRRE